MKRGSRKHKLLDYYVGIFLVSLCGLYKRLFRLKKKTLQIRDVKRVLFIKLAAVGDTLLFLAIVKAFKEKYPQIKIDFLASSVNEKILEGVPFIDRLWVIEQFGAAKIFRLIKKLKAAKYNLAIDGEQWSRLTPLIAFYAKISYLTGFRTKGQRRHFLYDEVIDHLPGQHESDCFLALVRGLGIESTEKPQLYFTPKVIEDSKNLIQELNLSGVNLLVIHPGCGRHGAQRQWPPDYYAQTVNTLKKSFSGLKVVITGGEDEDEIAREINQLLEEPAVNMCGKLTLMQMSYLISKAALFISGNTGPMHIAAAAAVPQIALCGPTNPRKWGPLNDAAEVIKSSLDCSPCLNLGFEYGCEDDKCMRAITVEEVEKAAEKLLGLASETPEGHS